MSNWVHDLWVFGVSVAGDSGRHWVYLAQGTRSGGTFEGQLIGFRAIDSSPTPGNSSTAMALVANSMAVNVNSLERGPIKCLMSNGLELNSRILQIQTI